MKELVKRAALNVTHHMNEIMANFKDGSKITVLIRCPENDDADFCMTNDDLVCVEAMVRRRIEERPPVPPLTSEEQKTQGARCGCLGADDYCGCQNVPDDETFRIRAETRAKAE